MSTQECNSLQNQKIAIIIPCYNEESTIIQVIDEILAIIPESFIYVFDNNSTDNSRKFVESKIHSLKAAKPSSFGNLFIYHVSTQGKGAVIREAFSLIEADVYVMIDADTQYDTSILPQALKIFTEQKLDMLNIARSAENIVYRLGHSFGNKMFSKLAQILFRTRINDILSGYRIFSYPFVKSFPAHSRGFEIETELTVFALQQHLRCHEIQASYKSRPEFSHSKLSTFKDGFKISLMMLNLLFSERPLFVFGLLSAICCSLSLYLGIPIVMEFLETSKVLRFPTLFVSVGFGVVSIIFGVAGLLAYLVQKGIKESRYLAYLNAKIPS